MSQLPPLSLLPERAALDKDFNRTASSGLEGSDDSSVDLREFVMYADQWGLSGYQAIELFDEYAGQDQFLDKEEFDSAAQEVYNRGISALIQVMIGFGVESPDIDFGEQDSFGSGYEATLGVFDIQDPYFRPGATEWSDFFGSGEDDDDDDNFWSGF